MAETVDNFLQRLRERPLLCDGAMGTELFTAGLPLGGCGLAWNIDNPTAVLAVHRAYIAAGCDVLTTNTFCGTHAATTDHNEHDTRRTIAMNDHAARLARQAADDTLAPPLVLGNAGPIDGVLAGRDTHHAAVHDALFTQFVALHEGGADGITIESVSDPTDMMHAIAAGREVDDWPIVASYAFRRDTAGQFVTPSGATVSDAMQAAIEAGAHVVGGNCDASLELNDNIELAAAMVTAAGDCPVVIQPNAGPPRQGHRGKLVYDLTPGDFAAIVPELLTTGTRLIGGCCGSTPAHIQAMAEAMRVTTP